MLTNTIFGCSGCSIRHNALREIQEITNLKISELEKLEKIIEILDETESKLKECEY